MDEKKTPPLVGWRLMLVKIADYLRIPSSFLAMIAR